jgi:hypothetical protein
MTILSSTTPTPAQAATAYKEVFGPVLEEAGGKNGRISRAGAERLARRDDAGKLVADNVKDYLVKTGQKTVSARKLTGVITAEVKQEAKKAAGPNQRLSLLEIRNLPQNMVADLLHLRGKDRLPTPGAAHVPTVEFTEAKLEQFMTWAATPWQPTETVAQGTFRQKPGDPIITGLQLKNADWVPAVMLALENHFNYNLKDRLDEGPFSLPGAGIARVGEVRDQATGKVGLLIYWNDIDDANSAFFYAKNDQGKWDLVHHVAM